MPPLTSCSQLLHDSPYRQGKFFRAYWVLIILKHKWAHLLAVAGFAAVCCAAAELPVFVQQQGSRCRMAVDMLTSACI
jgi:hypothetical protein